MLFQADAIVQQAFTGIGDAGKYKDRLDMRYVSATSQDFVEAGKEWDELANPLSAAQYFSATPRQRTESMDAS